MKIVKRLCSVVLVIIMLLCTGMCAFASVDDTFSIVVPYDFTKNEFSSSNTYWENFDASKSILAMVEKGKNTTNPADYTDKQLAEFDSVFRNEMETEFAQSDIKVISTYTSVVDFYEHSVIKTDLVADLLGDTFYIYGYSFVTENYSHRFIIYSEEPAADFADDLIKTVKIYDDPVNNINWLKILPIILGVIAIAAIVIRTVIRVKKHGQSDNTTKWSIIGSCIVVVIVILIKFIIK